jgi:integrase
VSGRSVGHPGLDALARRAARSATSAVRERQLWWVAGELARALDHADFPLHDAPVEDLFQREPLTAYLQLAAAGALRVRATSRTTDADSRATDRIRWAALQLLAEAGGVDADLPKEPPRPEQRPAVEPRPREMLRDVLTDLQERALGGTSESRLRMLAMGAIVADTGARAGELVDQTLNDLHPGLLGARIRRRPQGTVGDGHTRVDAVRLPHATQAALAAWLQVRHRIVDPQPGHGRRRGSAAPLEGSTWALWVSLRGSHGRSRDDGTTATYPPGSPLGARGLAHAWSSSVRETNNLLADEPGWNPLPERMEQLRRGVTPVPFDERHQPPREPDLRAAAMLTGALRELGAELASALRHGDEDREEGEATRVQRTQRAVRSLVDRLWLQGVGHDVVLSTMHDAGLHGPDLAAAGWHPALLESLDQAHRYGRAIQPDSH